MRRFLSAVAMLAILAGCGGGGGGGGGEIEPPPTPGPGPGPQPPPADDGVPPTLRSASLTDDLFGEQPDVVTVKQGKDTSIYIELDFEDADGDVDFARISYLTMERELTIEPPTYVPGLTEGSIALVFTAKAEDGVGTSSLDFWLVDSAGHESNKVRLSYVTVEGDLPGSSLNAAGRYEITFISDFGGSMRDDYDIVQVGGTAQIGWVADCDDPGNDINCFHMDDLAGNIVGSADGGRTFEFRMTDGFCVNVVGRFIVEGADLRVEGTKDAEGESFCSSSPAFPSGTFSGRRK